MKDLKPDTTLDEIAKYEKLLKPHKAKLDKNPKDSLSRHFVERYTEEIERLKNISS